MASLDTVVKVAFPIGVETSCHVSGIATKTNAILFFNIYIGTVTQGGGEVSVPRLLYKRVLCILLFFHRQGEVSTPASYLGGHGSNLDQVTGHTQETETCCFKFATTASLQAHDICHKIIFYMMSQTFRGKPTLHSFLRRL
jgi:hypothetical protein